MWLKSVDSTNNEAARRISSLDNLSVVSAMSQSAGRGQRGNTWISPSSENLTFSIIHKYATTELPAKKQAAVSAIAAISIIDLLSTFEIEAQIKWPNDVYVGEKKICGILMEHTISGEYIRYSIVGIGLNVNQYNFDVSLPNPTSIVLCTGKSEQIDTKKCLDLFMDIYKRNLCLLKDKDFSRIYDLFVSKLRPTDSSLEDFNHALLQ